jgi:hypothetical protein
MGASGACIADAGPGYKLFGLAMRRKILVPLSGGATLSLYFRATVFAQARLFESLV